MWQTIEGLKYNKFATVRLDLIKWVGVWHSFFLVHMKSIWYIEINNYWGKESVLDLFTNLDAICYLKPTALLMNDAGCRG